MGVVDLAGVGVASACFALVLAAILLKEEAARLGPANVGVADPMPQVVDMEAREVLLVEFMVVIGETPRREQKDDAETRLSDMVLGRSLICACLFLFTNTIKKSEMSGG